MFYLVFGGKCTFKNDRVAYIFRGALCHTGSCTQLNIKKRSFAAAVASRHNESCTQLNTKNAPQPPSHHVILTFVLN